MSNNSICPLDRTLPAGTTLGLIWLGSNGNEGVVHVAQSASITEAFRSDCLVSYPGNSLG